MLVDITDRKRRAGRRSGSPRSSSPSDDAIISKDLNGIIASWNQGAERLFGYSAEEIVGKSVTVLIPADHHNEEPESSHASGAASASTTTRQSVAARTEVWSTFR